MRRTGTRTPPTRQLAPGAGRTARLFLCAVTFVALLAGPALPALAEGTAFKEHYFTDTPSGQAYYFDVLGPLGIVRGERGFGGPSHPGDPVSRAEFAAMVLRLLSLDPAFKAPSQTDPAFSDVSSIPQWAMTAASACASLDIIKGVPDGLGHLSFRPLDGVGGAEALAMLLRALGNAQNVLGGWPGGYLYRAAETGLTSADVTVSDWRRIEALAPLTRAQTAYLLHNALLGSRDYQPGSLGQEGAYGRGSIVNYVGGYALPVEIKPLTRQLVTAEGKSLPLATNVVAPGVHAPNDLVGSRVFWLKNSLGQLAYLRLYSRDSAVTGVLAKLELRTGGTTVAGLSLADGRVIAVAPNALVELNGQRWPFDPRVILPNAEVTVVVDDGQAIYVSILQEDLPEVLVRRLVIDPGPASGQPPTGQISAILGMGQGEMNLLVTPETVIYLDGKEADLSDLREWDVFYAATQGSVPKRAVRLYAYRNRVTGEVKEVARYYGAAGVVRRKVTVEEVPGTARTLWVSPLCEDEVSMALTGQVLTFCLSRAGEITFFHTPGPGPANPLVVRVARLVEAGGRRLLTVAWQDQEFTYELPAGAEVPPVGYLTWLTPTSDAVSCGLKPVRPAVVQASVVAVDPEAGRLTIGREQVTWTLDAGKVACYRLPPGEGQGKVEGYVPLSALVPGQVIWLDDPATPAYLLVGVP